jgi:NAD(P)-dependent dehydrogenase (short-subunit alcohol dehydrogenase family)
MRASGGAIVVVGPSVALVGAPGLVPLVTLAEAQRTLVKSAARQWSAQGLRLNWIGVSGPLYSQTLRDARFPSVPELGPPPPALGRVPAIDAEVADVIGWLACASGVTGATLNLDGGDWMVP